MAFLPLGAFVALFGLLSYAAVRAQDRQALVSREKLTILGRAPFLAALQAYDLERLAQRSTWVEAPAGIAVITQGEPGDSFYVVASGELGVTVGTVRKEHTMVEGDGFGEIALLHGVARTATVTALTDSRLLALTAEDFLSTVMPNDSGATLARSLAEARWSSDLDGDAGELDA